MLLRSILFVIIVVALSCSNDPSTEIGHKVDNIDSLRDVSKTMEKENQQENELQNIIKEYVHEYNTPHVIDSVIWIANDEYHIIAKHYCLQDSAIDLPVGYIKMYKLNRFITHNFESTIRMTKNNKVIFNKVVVKNDFDKYLYGDLKKYGVLFNPELQIRDSSIILDYSISIPLTDVGIGVYMVMNDNGVEYKSYNDSE